MSLSSTPPDESALTQRGSVPRKDESTVRSATGRGVFFSTTAILYAGLILTAVLTVNSYFAQTWDVTTFIHAGQRFLDGGTPFDLYAQTRAAQTWPYAYPPPACAGCRHRVARGEGAPLTAGFLLGACSRALG